MRKVNSIEWASPEYNFFPFLEATWQREAATNCVEFLPMMALQLTKTYARERHVLTQLCLLTGAYLATVLTKVILN